LFNSEITKVEKPMAAILPSNGGNSEGLGDIEEKFSQEDFLVSWVTHHSTLICHPLSAMSYKL
jgi:hypothetical protein